MKRLYHKEKVAAETFFEYLQTENALKVFLKSMDSVLILLKWKRSDDRGNRRYRQIRKLTEKQKKRPRTPAPRAENSRVT